MAPKSSLLSHQPSKQEEERDESSSGEEEGDESEVQSCKEDQENSSDDETEEASSDDEEEIQRTQIPAPKVDSKRGNGSGSDPDSEGSPSDYMLQPIRKGSVSSSKRSRNEGSEIQDSLKSCKSSRIEEKKSASVPGGGAGCINRLWSNEDEIAVLNGMIEFKTAKRYDPNADMGTFHSFIKGKLKVDFSKDQLRTKVMRMKKRFLNALKKGEKGSDPVFSRPHEVLAFAISKKIWGGAVDDGVGGSNGNVKKKKGVQKVEKDVVDEREIVEKENVGEGGDFWSKYPNLNASFGNMKGNFPSLMAPVAGMSLLKEKLSLIGNVKAKELDDKWKQLGVEETELGCKILMLMHEQVQLALDQ